MPKTLIFGYGAMGRAAALFMDKLGYEVHAVDKVVPEEVPEYVNFIEMEYDNLQPVSDAVGGTDIVLSCLPAECNIEIANTCLEYGVKYCDLGGDEKISQEFRDRKNEWTNGVMTDLGVAPGDINMIAHRLCSISPSPPKEVYMYVGGITRHSRDNIMGWCPTWSYTGLMKNYTNPVNCLVKGEKIEIPSISGYHIPKLEPGWPQFEAFVTSGGIAHTIYDWPELTECRYYTLRWPGHIKMMGFLSLIKEHNPECIDKVIETLFNNLLEQPGTDIVVKYTAVINQDNEIASSYGTTTPAGGLSAMQIATAAPICTVANLMVEKNMCGYLTYKDIDY